MSRLEKLIIALTLLAVAAGTWTWRYVTLNRYYHGLAGEPPDHKVYSIGQLVPLENSGEGCSAAAGSVF